MQAMLITELPDIGTGKYDFVHALIHVLYGAALPYELFPTAAVVGTLMGLGQLAASSGTHRAARARPVGAG